MRNPFKYFNSSPEVIRIAVLMYVKYPLSLRNVEDLLAERGQHRHVYHKPEAQRPCLRRTRQPAEYLIWRKLWKRDIFAGERAISGLEPAC